MLKGFLSFVFILVSQVHAEANNVCSEVLKKNYNSRQMFADHEIYMIETLAAALVSSEIGVKKHDSFHGLQRVSIDRSEFISPEAIIADITEANKREIISFIRGNLSDFRTYLSWQMRHHVRKRDKKTKMLTFKADHIFNMMTRDYAKDEVAAFIEENIDAILINAAIMPIESRSVVALKMSAQASLVFTGAAAVVNTLSTFGIGWAVLPVEMAVTTLGFGVGSGVLLGVLDQVFTPSAAPKYVWHEYLGGLGQEVRDKYSYNAEKN